MFLSIKLAPFVSSSFGIMKMQNAILIGSSRITYYSDKLRFVIIKKNYKITGQMIYTAPLDFI